jgi:hypothetical protein
MSVSVTAMSVFQGFMRKLYVDFIFPLVITVKEKYELQNHRNKRGMLFLHAGSKPLCMYKNK